MIDRRLEDRLRLEKSEKQQLGSLFNKVSVLGKKLFELNLLLNNGIFVIKEKIAVFDNRSLNFDDG